MALFRRKSDEIDETLPALRGSGDDETMPTADVPDWFDAPVEELPPLPPIRRRRRGRRSEDWDPWSSEDGDAPEAAADAPPEASNAADRMSDEEWMRKQMVQPTVHERSPLESSALGDSDWSERPATAPRGVWDEPRDDGEWNERRYPGALSSDASWEPPSPPTAAETSADEPWGPTSPLPDTDAPGDFTSRWDEPLPLDQPAAAAETPVAETPVSEWDEPAPMAMPPAGETPVADTPVSLWDEAAPVAMPPAGKTPMAEETSVGEWDEPEPTAMPVTETPVSEWGDVPAPPPPAADWDDPLPADDERPDAGHGDADRSDGQAPADESAEGPDLDPTSGVLPALVEEGPLSSQLIDVKNRAREELSARLGARLFDREVREDQLESLIIEELGRFLYEHDMVLSEAEQERLAEELINDVLRHGPIEAYLQDPTVTEIMINSTDAIYIERGGRLFITESRFTSETHLRQVIERIAGSIGRRIDESSPMVDARLADGSRVNAIIPPLAVDGSAMTIRKFAQDRMTVDDLLEMGTMTPQVGAFIAACVRGRMNILVTGGTGSGKTTLLNVLSSYIPASERIVSIEDAVELQMHQRHVIRLESRPPNVEGRGQVTIRDLVRNALRMRPDRIVIGEVRGGEALDMLQAMNTGHDGSLSTLHANSPRDGLRRVETMVLMAGVDLPIRFVREQVASAVDMIVHLARLRDGTRRITHISEVSGMETDVITLNDVFKFDFAAGVGSDGRFIGGTIATGVRPSFLDRLEEQGIAVPASIFSPDGDEARGTRW